MSVSATLESKTAPGLVGRLDRNLYPSFSNNWDDELFRERILEHVDPSDHLLDVGAGAGIVTQMNFKGCCQKVYGIDPDPRVVSNPFLDEGSVGMGEDIPYPDESFDVIVADNVLEHLEQPEKVFAEVARVLRPGGHFFTKTPNKWHYMPVVARITPHGFHRFYNRLRGRQGEDTFPTRYLANTPHDQRRLAEGAGLLLKSADLVEGRPEYLRISAPTYLMGAAYERVVNHFKGLAPLRVLLVSTFVKEGGVDQ